MLTQLLAWAATLLGLGSTWLCGKHHASGWAVGLACCGLWVAVNWRLGVWAGVVSAVAAGALAGWNWWRWSGRPRVPEHGTVEHQQDHGREREADLVDG